MSNNWKEIYQNIQLGLSLDCDIIGDSYYLYSSIFSMFFIMNMLLSQSKEVLFNSLIDKFASLCCPCSIFWSWRPREEAWSGDGRLRLWSLHQLVLLDCECHKDRKGLFVHICDTDLAWPIVSG